MFARIKRDEVCLIPGPRGEPEFVIAQPHTAVVECPKVDEIGVVSMLTYEQVDPDEYFIRGTDLIRIFRPVSANGRPLLGTD